MKKDLVIILIRLAIAVVTLCGVEYLFERLILQRVISKQDHLIWWTFIFAGIFIALIGIVVNHIINKVIPISANAMLFVNITGGVLVSVLYLVINLNSNQNLIQFNSNKYEADYFLTLICSLFVLAASVIESIIYRISIK